MESEAIKRALVTESAGLSASTVKPFISVGREAESSNTNSSFKTLTQILFKSAISKLEHELLRKLFAPNENTELIDTQNHVVQNSLKEKFPYANKAVQNNPTKSVDLTELLNALGQEKSGKQESELVLKIIKNILGSNQTETKDKLEDPRMVLLRLLESVKAGKQIEQDSKTISAIKTQSNISPEMRATLLQSVTTSSSADALLIEQFLNRRDEVVSVKRDVLAILEKLLQTAQATENLAPLPTEQNSELMSKYLILLLNESADKLELIENKTSDTDLLRLLLASKVKLPISLIAPSENKATADLALGTGLQIDDIITQLSENLDPKLFESLKNYPASSDTRSFREILKNLLTSNSALFSSTNVSNMQSSEGALNQAFDNKQVRDILDLITTELNDKLIPSNQNQQDISEQTRIFDKLLLQSNLTKELIIKMSSGALNASLPSVSNSTTPIDIAEIALGSLKLAVELKSPQILRASGQFLRSSLSNKDILGAITSLLIPLLDIFSSSLDESNSEGRKEIKAIFDQIENLKTSLNKHETNIREISLQIFKKTSNFIETFEKLNPKIDSSKAEQQLMENITKESLNRLNSLAEQMQQPNLSTFTLQSLGGSTTLEIKSQSKNAKAINHEDAEQKDNVTASTAETIECSVVLPSLGECGVSFTIWDNQIRLNICNAAQEVIDCAQPLVQQLEKRLSDLSFDKPQIELNCSQPKSVKPGWLLEFLGSKQKA